MDQMRTHHVLADGNTLTIIMAVHGVLSNGLLT